MAHTYSHLYNIPTIGLRFFTVYGPWGRPDMAYYSFTKAILAGQRIVVYNKGDVWRDFTYIDDISKTVVAAADKAVGAAAAATSGSKDAVKLAQIYNVGNSKPTRLLDFI